MIFKQKAESINNWIRSCSWSWNCKHWWVLWLETTMKAHMAKNQIQWNWKLLICVLTCAVLHSFILLHSLRSRYSSIQFRHVMLFSCKFTISDINSTQPTVFLFHCAASEWKFQLRCHLNECCRWFSKCDS